MQLETLQEQITDWAYDLGFSAVGFVRLTTSDHEQHLRQWLAQGFHGTMSYMDRNIDLRLDAAGLLPGAISAVTVRMDYLSRDELPYLSQTLAASNQGYIARYALGRDYHKVIRGRLRALARRINEASLALPNGPFISRACTDSAPILEKRLAEQSGLGWIGKNTLLNDTRRGSWCVIGELLTNLPVGDPHFKDDNHCGSCQRCLEICPTQAFTGPYQLDARRCISYLTIESKEAIPVALRSAVGNRIFGCDDCQLVCPWNKFAALHIDADYQARAQFTDQPLLSLFNWSEAEFLKHTEGSPIRRTGYEGWLRNCAVALGNAPFDPLIVRALSAKRPAVSPMVQEHIDWALAQQSQDQATP